MCDMQFCQEPGCGVLVSAGRCPTHAPAPGRGLEVHRWHGTARWRRLRADILRRDPFCRACRVEGRRTLTVDIDHIVRHEGDPVRFWDAGNLQGLCRICHGRKTRGGA
jgi:5-methylcytosine-specific restriction protein A